MKITYPFDEVGRLPLPGDNVAVAIRQLDAGTTIDVNGQSIILDYTVMEGHRFAVKAIAVGEALLSWELPFGVALKPIHSGQYVINQNVLDELRVRSLDFALPSVPNFNDQVPPYVLDEANFRTAPEVLLYPDTRTFMGYRRSLLRGVGTRNYIVVMGTTSRTGSYVKQLAARLQGELNHYPHVDGIVPVAHTEGGAEQPNNQLLLLRTLAGFIVNPNVGAVLVVDYGTEAVSNKMVEAYIHEHHYPIHEVIHRFVSLSGGFQDQLNLGESIVRDWLPIVDAYQRTPESISQLKIGLQCGGSDAFSGISANPLLGYISQELVRYGGAANIAETDELIGAEPYMLQKVSNLETARRFLALIDQFKTRTAWHGASAEGNPSGGNKYRGLYNIYLKSIGAAQKKDPTTRLDYAIDYGEPMKQSGFYFMDSPGNDLESIAGQVAAGCNVIFFSTGNGSITNFPFVPTVKVVTTSRRFALLADDMDVNAGGYLEGLSMDELGKHTFELTLEVASGQRSVGEKAGHSQVQIWRDWRQTDASQLDSILHAPLPKGEPLPIMSDGTHHPIKFSYTRYQGQLASDQIGLILPTSLCAGQVAQMIINKLNQQGLGLPHQVSRYVTLTHTEGCGNSGGQLEQMYARTMVGYATHPMVKYCLMLEHGCEKTHNDYMRHQFVEKGYDPSRLGYASIQLDGGIDKVMHKVEAWFAHQIAVAEPTIPEIVGLGALRIGIVSHGPISSTDSEQLALLTKMIVGAGGTVVVPENSNLFTTSAYPEHLKIQSAVLPSIAYGEAVHKHGFHIMETPTEHWVETLTGLAATGVEIIIAWVNTSPMQSHPLVPMVQVTSNHHVPSIDAKDVDMLLTGDPSTWNDQILALCKQVLEHNYTPRTYRQGNVDFQFTRGLLGVSL